MDKVSKILLIAMAVVLTIGLIDLAVALAPEYQTVEFSSDYYALMDKDVVYSEQINIGTSVSTYSNFELTLWGDWKSGIVNVFIDSVSCSPNGWTTPSADGYRIRFDCTDAVNNAVDKKNLNLTYLSDKDAENVYGTVKATYLTKGEPVADVHGTEYTIGQTAHVWVHFLNATGDYIDDGACQVDVYTPSGEELIEKGAMTNANHDGIYFYDFPTDNLYDGVFMTIARCYADVIQNHEHPDSATINTGVLNDKTYLATHELGGDRHKIEQDNGVIEVEYDVDNMCGLTTDELLLTGLSVTTVVKWENSPVNDDLKIYVYNYTASDWILLPNKIVSPNDLVPVNNFITTNNITRDGYVDGSGTLTLKFNDTLTTGTDKKAEFDFIEVLCEEFADSEWIETRGSSEVHISVADNLYWSTQVESGEVTDDTWTGDFTYNVTLASQTEGTRQDQEIYVDLPTPFPCHHVKTLTVDGTPYNWTPSQPENPLRAGCRVNWEQDLTQGVNYDIQIVSENWFKEEEQNWITQSQIQYDFMRVACENFRIESGLDNYTIPATAPLNYSYGDALWRSCQQYLDQYYHFNATYFNEFKTDTGVFTEADMKGLDEQWTHLLETKNNLDTLSQSIASALDLASDYSVTVLADPNNLTSSLWSQLFASISDGYLNFQQIFGISTGLTNVSVDTGGVSQAVWNYSSRELTDFPFDVNVLNRVDATTPEVLVGATEYQTGDTGKISVRLIKSQGGEGEPEVNADCNGSILYPNNTLYVDKDPMTEYGEGVYTFDFATTSTEGVHTYFVDCFAGNETENRSYYTLNTFHVSDLGEDVWTHTPDRNLTFYETSDETDYNLIQELVWNRSTRELTYYETANVTLDNSSIQAVGDAVWDYTGEVNNNLLTQFGEKIKCYVNSLLGGDDEWAVDISSC